MEHAVHLSIHDTEGLMGLWDGLDTAKTFERGEVLMPAGRPTSLTPDVQEAVLVAIAAGNYRVTACKKAGISNKSLINWEKAGAEGVEPYKEFFLLLQKAEAAAEAVLLASVKAADKGWQAQAWIMERRWPERWGGRVRLMVTEERELLLDKVKKDPELHERLREVITRDEPAQGSAPSH